MDNNIRVENCSTNGRFDIAVCSGIGKRESQQDSAYYHVSDSAVFAVVCDGMGGLGGGDRASATAASVAAESYRKHLAEAIQREQIAENTEVPGEIAEENAGEWMAKLVLDADRAVFELQDEDGSPLRAGSTLAAVWISENGLFWSSVGDSRVYLFRGNESIQLTTDLNYFYVLNQRRMNGEITEEEYRKEAHSGEALISFCGRGEIDFLDRNLEPLSLMAGDVIVVCSDGVYRKIDKEWMSDVIFAADSMEDAAAFIPMILEEHGGSSQDNYTCIFVKMNASNEMKGE